MKSRTLILFALIALPLCGQTSSAERIERLKAESARRMASIEYKLAHRGAAYSPAPRDPEIESYPHQLTVSSRSLGSCAEEFADFADMEVFVSWKALGVRISIDQSIDSPEGGAQAFRDAFYASGISEIQVTSRIAVLVTTTEFKEANQSPQPTSDSAPR